MCNTKKILVNIGKISTVIAGFFAIGKVVLYQNRQITEHAKKESAYKKYYEILQIWMHRKNSNRNISVYLLENNIHKVAIYGKGVLGDFLALELKDTEIEVIGFIDRLMEETQIMKDGMLLCALENAAVEMDECEAVIVTPLYDFETISKNLRDNAVKAYILGIDELLKESI